MLDSKPTCPTCGSKHPVKNGRIHNKKSKYHCQNCGRQFGENPTKKVISPSLKDLIDKLLLEKISWAGIARVIGGSEPWLQKYVNAKYAKIPQQLEVSEKLSGLTIECDEAWSFVGNKNNQQWKELAMDVQTREIVGVYVGARSRESALKLWNSLPTVYPLSFRGARIKLDKIGAAVQLKLLVGGEGSKYTAVQFCPSPL